jgi:hypothetical protein
MIRPGFHAKKQGNRVSVFGGDAAPNRQRLRVTRRGNQAFSGDQSDEKRCGNNRVVFGGGVRVRTRGRGG